ncbi:MAG: leucine-rich repeat domain-containing protein [Paludibacteraceae bacterium]|nr:leucine-rich repeat domain-containing protein [Paludibacteraceae bacterium]
MRKKLFTFLLALVASVGMSYAAPNDSGTCGANVTYSFDGATGAMTITGTGPMTEYSSKSNCPWDGYRTSITSVTVTDGVTTVSSNSFGQCTSLQSVTIGNDVETIGEFSFNDCGTNFTSLTLGSSVKSVGFAAFLFGTNIAELVLPESLETINDYAFCQLRAITTVTIPSKVTSIGVSAFYNCNALTSIYTEATTPPTLGDGVFSNVNADLSTIPLYVPNGSVNAYKAADQWKAFNIQGYDPAPGGGSTPDPEPASSVTAARFVYNYDCQRNPAYPKKETACTLSGFKDPLEGYKGTRNGNIALGPWKLEFVAYYTPSNNYGCASQVNTAVYQYYSNLSSQEREAKKLEMPIFRLWQYNLAAQEFQPAAYGVVCAYASEGNIEDHGALFISSNSYGCFLSGHQHTTSFALTCENDLTTGLTALVDAASAPSDPYYDVVWPVIVSIDAIGPVELSEHCKYYIEGSRAAYDALTDEQKAQVTNYSTLTNAETQWAALAAVAQPYADAVIDLINAIPNPVVYTQQCKDAIDAAQAAYNALTDGQKVLVTNAETLLQAPITFINVAHPNILFTANSNEKRIEDVTLPKSFTAGYFSTDNEFLGILKELYGINEDAYINFIYSNNDAVTRSGNNLTVNPFSGTATVSGSLVIMSTSSDSPYSVNITLELPPLGPAPASADEQVPTNADPVNPSYHYSTFFHSTQNYKLTNDGTQAFIADLSGSDLVLTKIAEGTQVIPANTAVILRKSGSADPVVLTPTEENGVSVNPNDNSLKGVDAITAVTSIDGLTTTNCYVLSGTNDYGVGFYRINSENLKAHKAYVKYAGLQNNAPKRMRFIFNNGQVATDIERVQSEEGVQKRIENGRLIIIRDGVYYNAQGQTVK